MTSADDLADEAPPTALQRLLADVDKALARGDSTDALRFADAAARRSPESPDVLQLFGRVGMRCGEFALALGAFQRAAALRQDPALEADLIEALAANGRLREAAARLDKALAEFAVEPGDRLALTARRVVMADPSAFGGWVGVTPDLELVGEVFEPDDDAKAKLAADFGVTFSEGARASQLPGPLPFIARAPPRRVSRIGIALGGLSLRGSGAPYPPVFRLDGRGRIGDGVVEGWVRLGWAPGRTPTIVVRDNLGRQVDATVHADPLEAGRYTYRAEVLEDDARCSALTVLARTPDGAMRALPDSPIFRVLPPPPKPTRRSSRVGPSRWRGSSRMRRGPIDVIIPVYQGFHETLACIASVKATVGAEAEIVIIDDGTPDRELAGALDDLEKRGDITLLRNLVNRGFPAAVNRGLSLHPKRDVVILNSDAEVFPGWLARLRRAAYAGKDIATVTPLSNSGSIASYPLKGSVSEPGEGAWLAALAGEVNAGLIVDTPTAVGFCMFVRRDCLDEIGLLDTAAFGAGYGEENDLCLRAAARGWRHVVAPDVFVSHIGGRSFGSRREALLERNLAILNARYPGYEQLIAEHQQADSLRTARRRLDEARLRSDTSPCVLLISLDLSGGVERLVRQRADHWRGQGRRVLLLKPTKAKTGIRIEEAHDARLDELNYESPDDQAAVMALLRGLPIGLIEFHHFLDLDPTAVDAALGLGLPYDVYIHDYSWICPRITLLDTAARYCGEPRLRACEICARKDGARLGPGLKVRDLRDRSRRWLSGARSVVAPSRDVQSRLRRYFPTVEIQVQAWETGFTSQPSPSAGSGDVVRVAMIGAIGEHKGFGVLLACAKDAVARELPLEFSVIGYTEDDEKSLQSGNVFITGEYREEEIDSLIRREAPHVAFFASVWPETWCFALTHALRAGLPVLAFDSGAIAERLKSQDGLYQLLPLGASEREINDTLLNLTRQYNPANAMPESNALVPTESALAQFQPPASVIILDEEQGGDSLITANSSGTLMEAPRSPVNVTAEVLPLTKGIYQFTVDSATPRRVEEVGDLTLPALHIGPGPGVPPENVEVMTGLRNEETWLYEAGDTLILKIKANSTSILMTSVRTDAMAPLDISVERLDGRRQRTSTANAALPALPPAAPSKNTQALLPSRADAMPARPDGSTAGNALGARIMAHIANRGDTNYVDRYWAGEPGENLPIEAFSITPLEHLLPGQLEYKALTATGVETGWIGGGKLCGTRGAGVPLLGFAVRIKSDSSDRFDCEYRGMFRSGRVVGPLTNGAPCRATDPDDYLEAIQLTLALRRRPIRFTRVEPADPPSATDAPSTDRRRTGPKFSVFREDPK